MNEQLITHGIVMGESIALIIATVWIGWLILRIKELQRTISSKRFHNGDHPKSSENEHQQPSDIIGNGSTNVVKQDGVLNKLGDNIGQNKVYDDGDAELLHTESTITQQLRLSTTPEDVRERMREKREEIILRKKNPYWRLVHGKWV